MLAHIKSWREKLIDLSRRNRLLYFKPTKRGHLRVLAPSFEFLFSQLLDGEDSLKLVAQPEVKAPVEASSQISLEKLLPDFSSPRMPFPVRLLPPPQPKAPLKSILLQVSESEIEATLSRLFLKFSTSMNEQGVAILHLTFGMLEWRESESSDSVARSPLLLAPVELVRKGRGMSWYLKALDDDLVINPALVHKLGLEKNFSFPELPSNLGSDGLSELLEMISKSIKSFSGWSVVAEAWLGLFSFQKLVMFKDLESLSDRFHNHPLVSALAGNISNLVQPTEVISESDLDSLVKPGDCFQVLDADSSQQEAIEAAKRGMSLVLQGPPGTGKSQTIANIISELLAAKKRVLFVSEKMAALEIVFQRLKEAGLADFCLELHSHKANKVNVIRELAQTLERTQQISQDAFEQFPQELENLRNTLNNYVSALHIPRPPLQRSVYEVIGLLSQMSADFPECFLRIPEPTDMPTERVGQIQELLQNLRDFYQLFLAQSDHPWWGVSPDLEPSLALNSEVRARLERLKNSLEAIHDFIAKTSACFEGAFTFTFEGFGQTADLYALVPHLKKAPISGFSGFKSLESVKILVEKAIQAQAFEQSCQDEFAKLYEEGLLKELEDRLDKRFEISYTGFSKWLRPSYWLDLLKIKEHSKEKVTPTYEQALFAIQKGKCVLNARENFKNLTARLAMLFPACSGGNSSDWQEMLLILESQTKAINLIGNSRSSTTELPRFFNEFLSLADKNPFSEQLKEALSDGNYISRMLPHAESIGKLNFTKLRENINEKIAQISSLSDSIRLQQALQNARIWGLSQCLGEICRLKLSESQITPLFWKHFWQTWLSGVMVKDPRLNLSGKERDRALQRFRELDKQLPIAARQKLLEKLVQEKPNRDWAFGAGTAVGILRREAEKRRRQMPIRQLFLKLQELLLRLKPCLLMSPMSVAQFLQANEGMFDVVLFDEASQISPEDAVGSLFRARQAIVAGDRHQLPPTRFFELSSVFEESSPEEVDGELLESILDEFSAAGLPTKCLKWHYRSKHESLIAFSNWNMYENKLVTFPSPRFDNGNLGVSFVHVEDGFYERGKSRSNPREANKAAELLVKRSRMFPHRSFGLIAFSEPQQIAILDAIEKKAVQDPIFSEWLDQKRQEPVFVKNLENVQGDERDEIIFSIGYGPDAAGNLTMNFGPLSLSGGERRLNVAITRGRLHCTVVSTILPEQIDLKRVSLAGPVLLKGYLEFVRAGGKAPTNSSASEIEQQAPFVESIMKILKDADIQFETQVGYCRDRIDLALTTPGREDQFILGVECDGLDYLSSKTVRDRDRLRPQVLRELGWNIHRVWSLDWVNEPENLLKTLLARFHESVEEAIQQPNEEIILEAQESISKNEIVTEDALSEVIMVKDIPECGAPPGPFSGIHPAPGDTLEKRVPSGHFPSIHPVRGYISVFHFAPHMKASSKGSKQAISKTLKKLLFLLIENEGPASRERLYAYIKSCLAIARLAGGLKETLEELIQNEIHAHQTIISDSEGFLKLSTMLETPLRIPQAGEKSRKFEEICIDELSGLISICVREAGGIQKASIVSEFSHFLGFARTGEKSRNRLLQSVNHAIEQGLINETNEGFLVSPQ